MIPPLALTSSRQISSASRFCLPLGATPPVSAMLKPTLIGSAACAGAAAHGAASRIANATPKTARLASMASSRSKHFGKCSPSTLAAHLLGSAEVSHPIGEEYARDSWVGVAAAQGCVV